MPVRTSLARISEATPPSSSSSNPSGGGKVGLVWAASAFLDYARARGFATYRTMRPTPNEAITLALEQDDGAGEVAPLLLAM